MDTKQFSRVISRQAHQINPPKLRQITLKVAAVNGINLGQGVCQLPVPEVVRQAAHRAIDAGVNRYTNPRGLQSTREAIARKLSLHNKISADPEKEILITCGSTGAFEGICAALLNPGDEVVSFSPYYPYHHNTLRRFEIVPRYVKLNAPDWKFDFADLEKAFSTKTKFILINTPGNPTGKVFTAEELEFISKLCEKWNSLVVTDEIYEYMVFDGHRHISPGSIPSLKDRTLTIGGYSKTFAITGWRIGYLIAPAELAEVITPLLDSIYICPPAPLQQAVADAIDELGGEFYSQLAGEYSRKRKFFSDALAHVGLTPFVSQGSYYMMASFGERFPHYSGDEFVDHLIETARVGAVPASDFVEDASNEKWMRFCYAVPDEMLEQAAEQLKALK